MTPSELEELKQLCADATEGPWANEVWHNHDEGGWAAVGPHAKDTPGDDFYSSEEPGSPSHKKAFSDSLFIAASRTAVPALIAEVERLRGLVKAAEKGAVSRYENCPWCGSDSYMDGHLSCPAFTPKGEVR